MNPKSSYTWTYTWSSRRKLNESFRTGIPQVVHCTTQLSLLNSRAFILKYIKIHCSDEGRNPGPHYTLLLIQLMQKYTFMSTGAKFIQRNIFTSSHTIILFPLLLFQAVILSETWRQTETWPAPAPKKSQNLNISSSLQRIWLIGSTYKFTEFDENQIWVGYRPSKYWSIIVS